MSESVFQNEDTKKVSRGGIKSPTFTATGTNGSMHRQNKVKKARQAQANRAARAGLYQERSRLGAAEWHMRLSGISKGTA